MGYKDAQGIDSKGDNITQKAQILFGTWTDTINLNLMDFVYTVALTVIWDKSCGLKLGVRTIIPVL